MTIVFRRHFVGRSDGMTSRPGHAPPRGGRVPPTAKSKERGEAPYFAPEAFDTVTIRTYTCRVLALLMYRL